MMRRILPIVAIAVMWAAYFATEAAPLQVWWWAVISFVIQLAVAALFLRASPGRTWEEFLPWIIGMQSALFAYLLIDRYVLRIAWLYVLLLASGMYWYRMERRAFGAPEGDARAGVRMGMVWCAIAVFASGATLSGWNTFIGLNPWLMMAEAALMGAYGSWNVWKLAMGALTPEHWLYIWGGALLLVEWFWVGELLTVGYMTKGLLWASGAWYVWWVGIESARKRASFARVSSRLAALFGGWGALLFAARWF